MALLSLVILIGGAFAIAVLASRSEPSLPRRGMRMPKPRPEPFDRRD